MGSSVGGRFWFMAGLGKYIDPMRIQLPSRCFVCHTWPSTPVCNACVARFAQVQARCQRCALPMTGPAMVCGSCLIDPPPLDACFAAVPYSYPWSGLVTVFKFQQEAGWAGQFAQMMRSMPWVEPALDQVDWVIPMPLSDQRLRERGYNQAWELAKQLTGRGLRHKLRSDLLFRIAHTPPQPGLPRAQRIRNLSQAFAVNPMLIEQVESRRIALVDDVMTTGASLFSAASTLRRAGAVHITGLVLARTDVVSSVHNSD